MLSPNNFIYFFTACGFFIGLMFTIINFSAPEDIVIYTAGITLFFYLFIHVVIMNFIDLKLLESNFFKKKEHEEVGDYFLTELDEREKKMDSLLLELDKMNKKYAKETKSKKSKKSNDRQKAA